MPRAGLQRANNSLCPPFSESQFGHKYYCSQQLRESARPFAIEFHLICGDLCNWKRSFVDRISEGPDGGPDGRRRGMRLRPRQGARSGRGSSHENGTTRGSKTMVTGDAALSGSTDQRHVTDPAARSGMGAAFAGISAGGPPAAQGAGSRTPGDLERVLGGTCCRRAQLAERPACGTCGAHTARGSRPKRQAESHGNRPNRRRFNGGGYARAQGEIDLREPSGATSGGMALARACTDRDDHDVCR